MKDNKKYLFTSDRLGFRNWDLIDIDKMHEINADENEAIAKTMQIEALPTLFLYKNKKEVWKHVGYISKEDLEKIISKHQK